jgi:hypothetical protein
MYIQNEGWREEWNDSPKYKSMEAPIEVKSYTRVFYDSI